MITDSSVRDALSAMDEKHKRLITPNEYSTCSNVDSTDIRNFPNRGKVYLRESGLYRLIFQSRKPEAEVFKDWLAMEVLPSLRKTGAYGVAKAPQNFAESLRMLADKIEETEKAKAQLQLVSGKLIETEHDRQVLQEIVEPQDTSASEMPPRLSDIRGLSQQHLQVPGESKRAHEIGYVEKPYSFYPVTTSTSE
jgi:prophage antirepressor-like protein